ncbi:hypothetical protein MPTK1_7g09370 [Marchantia polymorpha subsp. ruderalis]|uniref:Secreted protein n=2 Tax=Marchantia polymorpha TaxID=3197 RepID=A0AAF6BXR5_MARPO|nr:hypothetical protein MARPO_0068s0090 [Marchantia polymorpha]BBN16799.1 hypothetical protein Mp_7g09370 [Marchantia polymorpha subsp. ruderalis]|eukprot:PTQ35882.1 hypothetical protein MARPO_0068s0090 [Marchantia polymorpha]
MPCLAWPRALGTASLFRLGVIFCPSASSFSHVQHVLSCQKPRAQLRGVSFIRSKVPRAFLFCKEQKMNRVHKFPGRSMEILVPLWARSSSCSLSISRQP